MKTRIVALFGDGLDAAGRLPALAAARDADVVTVSVDLGHTTELDGLRQRALAAGAMRAHVLDLREEFAREYVLPALQSGVLEEGGSAMRTLAAPLIDRTLAQIAAIEQAEVAADDASMLRIDPVRRGRSLEAPADTAHLDIEFTKGVVSAVNGVPMRGVELLESLTTIACGHHVGNADALYGPAVTVLRAAYGEGDASRLTGTVRLKLTDGACTVVSRMVLAEA